MNREDWQMRVMGVATLRLLNATKLRALTHAHLIIAGKQADPIAALVPYELFLRWQTLIKLAGEAGRPS